MLRKESKRAEPVRMQVPMRDAGAECFVVALKSAKAGGAKEAHHLAQQAGQPEMGGARERSKTVSDSKEGRLEGV